MFSVPVSHGELIDKFTILQIKSERLIDRTKIHNVMKEITSLQPYVDILQRRHGVDLTHLRCSLLSTNKLLWDVEERVREFESLSLFGDEFIKQARLVYKYNGERYQLKSKINALTNSSLVEEKSH